MTMLTRFNPFKTTPRFEPIAGFDDLFRNLGMRTWPSELPATPDMRIDLSEDDKSFHIQAEMPGVRKEDIDVKVEGAQVTIVAEARRESEKKIGKEIYTERLYGTAYRSFALPHDVDPARVEAHYDAGVLSLMLPKKANGSVRRIAVS